MKYLLKLWRKWKGVCPKCSGAIDKQFYSLSRRDNTKICSDCGTMEALEDMEVALERLRGVPSRNGRT